MGSSISQSQQPYESSDPIGAGMTARTSSSASERSSWAPPIRPKPANLRSRTSEGSRTSESTMPNYLEEDLLAGNEFGNLSLDTPSRTSGSPAMSPRQEAYDISSHRLVIAVDYGTTFTGKCDAPAFDIILTSRRSSVRFGHNGRSQAESNRCGGRLGSKDGKPQEDSQHLFLLACTKRRTTVGRGSERGCRHDGQYQDGA